MKPVVHIVDDDASFARALSRLLRASGYEVATHESAEAFFAAPHDGAGGCVLLDLQMPGADGLDVQRRLAASDDPLPVVFVSGTADVPAAVRAMHGGADDVLTKRADLGQIVRAVEHALARDRDVRAAAERRTRTLRLFAALSPRERQVLGCVLRGMQNKAIAAELGIHERTVKLHRSAISAKTGVRAPAELARLAVEAGFESG